jgi:ABC-type glycerol-3-phosphate transport system permease component
MNSQDAVLAGERIRRRGSAGKKARTFAFHLTASLISLLWIGPLLLVFVLSFRSFDDILGNGLMAFPRAFSLRGIPRRGVTAVVGEECEIPSSLRCQRLPLC